MSSNKNQKYIPNEKKLINNSIPMENIANNTIYNNLIDDLICLVCLNIPLEPIQCSKCDIVLCKDCLEILNLSQKNCLTQECQNLNISTKKLYVKATKFVKEVLDKLIVSCQFCGLEKIDYAKYKGHLEDKCDVYKSLENKREDFIKKVKSLREKEEQLRNDIESTSTKFSKMNVIERDDPEFLINLRNNLITNRLNAADKKAMHNAILEGNLPLFKNMIIDRKYPIFEEISAKTYFWTSLHYSMHYGKWNIVEFILKHLKDQNQYNNAMKLRSNDNRCPILCLLKSNALKNEQKKEILDLLLKDFDINLTQDINKELIARNFTDLAQKFNK